MSIKNQRPLFISAAIIIGITTASLVALDFIIDHISKLSPPSIAMAEPQHPPSKPLSTDDAIEKQKMPPERPYDGDRPAIELRGKPKVPDMRDRQPDDALRRVRNGKDSPDIRRTQPPSPQNGKDDAQQGPRGMPSYPQPGNGYYPPPYPMDPKERERFEREMEQRGPPPGYYPPQGYYPPPQGYPSQEAYPDREMYENGYDYGEEYYDEYDPYYEDLDSRLDKGDLNIRTADVIDANAADIAYEKNPQLDTNDDFLYDDELNDDEE